MNYLDNDSIPPGYFKNKYADIIQLHGSRWLAHIPEEDRKAFSRIGLQYSEYGRLGGVQRAKNAMRDSHGRFACNEPDKECSCNGINNPNGCKACNEYLQSVLNEEIPF